MKQIHSILIVITSVCVMNVCFVIMIAIEDEMNVSDLRHLFRYCGNNPRKGMLARKIAEKENRKGDE